MDETWGCIPIKNGLIKMASVVEPVEIDREKGNVFQIHDYKCNNSNPFAKIGFGEMW